ncbi:hypothetical protein A2230_02360 [candidate division WOR-1 bacterium RIFOXYA2_FULL_36_21]|uniref:Peptidase M20 dimerisation domain-containing protein n=1 Tax=candidate division WOR-1 bacterium RIFOXYB2_FULL_36_35 TaxID=1802578 RepID=A0A1F4S5U2_UNCSA|nr:MAG: hypothetical protein A2230_02360 [candidate division WOR-1 bacterium RIFOXYA2_FULL_36_21]OGC15806.1 MAG: hypothetical protein A2290_05665 [candidate division WOR-1 bacterium RIFOXYB2_FULL_36_35]OGC16934.1 MAG: hypothetical protein A2282_03850 [candidate division WOR-1 bacterium RIFOXYA12_FULL_36_13]
MINKDRLLKRFIKYIKTPSPSGEEKTIGKLLLLELKLLGGKVSQDKIGNIFAYFNGRIEQSKNVKTEKLKNKKTEEPILLNAHIDTVAYQGKIEPQIKNGKIISKGDTILGADNKAGVAVILEVLQTLKEEKNSHPDIQVILTVREEIGLFGSREIKKKDIKAKLGFVLDGGEISNIHNQGPAQFNVTATIIGKPAHAGVHPEDGINAIKVASEAIAKMKLGRIDFETTANIGVIEGGTATNIIPEKVFLKGEARSRTPTKLQKQLNHMEECLQKACLKYRAKLKLNINKVYDSFNIGKKDPLIKLAERALSRIGLTPKLVPTGGGSDANNFSKLGVKCLILGVGAHKIHSNDEYIKINDLYDGARFIIECLKRQ